MPKQYPANPTRRLVDTPIPNINVADVKNPVLQKVMQLPEFGWHDCTPQMASVKLRESFAHIPAPQLAEEVAHAKRWIKEKITAYIDGELPVWLRAPKYVIDVIRIIQYAARLVATLNYIISLLNKEVALTNAWAGECLEFVSYAKSQVTKGALATESERVLIDHLDVALGAITQQIGENGNNLACII